MASHGKRLAVASPSRIHLYERHGSEWQAQSIIDVKAVRGVSLGITGPLAYDGETLAFSAARLKSIP